jgi:hypothetical protein
MKYSITGLAPLTIEGYAVLIKTDLIGELVERVTLFQGKVVQYGHLLLGFSTGYSLLISMTFSHMAGHSAAYRVQ